MESLNVNKKIDETNYLQYIDELTNIFRLSSSDKYIIFSLKIVDNLCNSKMTIYNQEGISEEYSDLLIQCGDYFYPSFLKTLVQKIEEVCMITQKDIVNLDGDLFVAFRMITSHNDLITIDGLNEAQAACLLSC